MKKKSGFSKIMGAKGAGTVVTEVMLVVFIPAVSASFFTTCT